MVTRLNFRQHNTTQTNRQTDIHLKKGSKWLNPDEMNCFIFHHSILAIHVFHSLSFHCPLLLGVCVYLQDHFLYYRKFNHHFIVYKMKHEKKMKFFLIIFHHCHRISLNIRMFHKKNREKTREFDETKLNNIKGKN